MPLPLTDCVNSPAGSGGGCSSRTYASSIPSALWLEPTTVVPSADTALADEFSEAASGRKPRPNIPSSAFQANASVEPSQVETVPTTIDPSPDTPSAIEELMKG